MPTVYSAKQPCVSYEIMIKQSPSHPVVCGGNHQSVWHQDGSFGLLDVSDGYHRDSNLGWTNHKDDIKLISHNQSKLIN